eukprot:2151702-Pleurochrysis_carterae.AAC.2
MELQLLLRASELLPYLRTRGPRWSAEVYYVPSCTTCCSLVSYNRTTSERVARAKEPLYHSVRAPGIAAERHAALRRHTCCSCSEAVRQRCVCDIE